MSALESGFNINQIEVRPVEGLIVGPAGSVRVEPKAMAVLVELARHSGEVCSREQIQDAVWPRGYTTDDVLTRCIGQLRRALGDDPKNPQHLETLPRRGYRLITRVVAPSNGNEPVSVEAQTSGKLIVLPFQYLAADSDDFIADGMTELLTARLALLQGIAVVSRTTAMSFKGTTASLQEVSARTGAEWVVEGSILQSGDRIQVVVQLIDARTDAHIWADDYLRDLGDILPLQNEIARKIAGAVRVRLGAGEDAIPAEPTLSATAMRNYLLGRYLISQRSIESLRSATECFTRVCQEFPGHADAWASRAECRFMLCHYGAVSPIEGASACRADIDRALGIDPDNAIALTCRGTVRFSLDGDHQGAETDLTRALELSPGYAFAMLTLGNVYVVQQRFEESNRLMEQAVRLDPLDVGINMNFGDHLILQRRYSEAIDQLRVALSLKPDHRPSKLRLAWALALAGNAKAALTGLASTGPRDDHDWRWLEYAALVNGALGRTQDAAGYWSRISALSGEQFVSAWSLARAASAADDPVAAIDWLGKAFKTGSTSLPFIPVTPAFDSLRDNDAFQRFLNHPGAPLSASG